MPMSSRFLMVAALVAGIVAPHGAAADQPLTMNAAMQKLHRQGAEGIIEMVRRDGDYRAVVRRSDGSHAVIAVDLATGRISAVEDRDLLRNSLDTQFVVQWLRVFTDQVVPEMRPAADVVRGLMASGRYSDLHSLRTEGTGYIITMRTEADQLVTLTVDGRATAVAADKPGV